jgi:hypothetical protein
MDDVERSQRALVSRRIARIVSAGVLGAALGAPVPVFAGVVAGTTTTMSVDPNPVDYTADWTMHATVTANEPAGDNSDPSGTVRWWQDREGGDIFLAQADLVSGETEASAVMSATKLPGTYTVHAEFTSLNGSFTGSESAPYEVTVNRAPTTIQFGNGEPEVELGVDINLTTIPSAALFDDTGSMAYYQVGNPTPLCTHDVEMYAADGCAVDPPPTLGTVQYYAEYLGGDLTAPATSETINVEIVPNGVNAHDVGLEYSTFYPIKDGYRDTVDVQGYRDEDASVEIKIYNPAGSLIKTASVPLGLADYAWAWNGRNGAGDVLPSGEYKVKQILTDAYDSTKTFTDFVTLSKKKLIWHSASITKDGDAFAASGKDGDGSVAVNKSAGVVRLRTPDGFGGDWSGVGYQFSLKDAVAYKGVKLSVYTTRDLVGGPSTQIGAQDFDDCAYSTGTWQEGCFDKWESIDFSTTRIWTRTNALAERHFAGRKVRSMVSNGSGTTFIYKAKVTYKYATLG